MAARRDAAVLVPVYRDAGGVARVVLIRRADRGLHAGEIALPGGRPTAGDATPAVTAVRETTEELGMPAAGIEVVESLPAVHTRASGFRVHPFLARIEPPRQWTPQATEVAAVLELAIAELRTPAAGRRERVQPAPGLAPLAVDCLRVGEVRIWGATYRILAPLLERLERSVPHR